MDLTPDWVTAVRRARERQSGSSAAPADRVVRKRSERSPVHTAADQIATRLRRLAMSVATRRPAYLNFRGLGTHDAMSDDEREAFDEEIRLTLREADRGVVNLKQVAPSIGRTHGADCSQHFEALVGMLEMKCETIGADAQDLQMARAKHMADGRHGFSLLRAGDTQKLNRMKRPPPSAPASSMGGGGAVSAPADDSDAELEADNAVLAQELVHRSGQRKHDITALHQQMSEIASQNQRLAHMLHNQNEVIDTLHADAEETEENVDAGNKELQQAVSRDDHSFRNLVVGLLLGASACLLFLDYYS